MNSPTITTTAAAAPDQTERARQIIELGLALDPEMRSHTLARLIAASLHEGSGTALEHFAATGTIDAENMLGELNYLVVPLEREGWVDALGRYVLFSAGARS
ncbi:hypothetical protein [uncultured Salinibacterium sp.]|uniref:hypothetical protein n=1 Tax=uncultured Salinibacterium sp. TaxID=459274 RepID=UPI0030DB263E|tara:strand:+ start:131320 stop:131625 length:306 start_codon:yes stop_codon:yes gene_type:complete